MAVVSVLFKVFGILLYGLYHSMFFFVKNNYPRFSLKSGWLRVNFGAQKKEEKKKLVGSPKNPNGPL